MPKEKFKSSIRNKKLLIGSFIAVIIASCVLVATTRQDNNHISDKEIRAAFIQKYSTCLKDYYDLANGARISVNPTDADGHTDPIISQQVAILSTLNSNSKPSVLRFDYSIVNEDTLFNDHFVPRFVTADQETDDYLRNNCQDIDHQ